MSVNSLFYYLVHYGISDRLVRVCIGKPLVTEHFGIFCLSNCLFIFFWIIESIELSLDNKTEFSMFQVSIMQIASDTMVFIFDLIKLYKDVPDVLDNCLTRILRSPRILKLGMKVCLFEKREILSLV